MHLETYFQDRQHHVQSTTRDPTHVTVLLESTGRTKLGKRLFGNWQRIDGGSQLQAGVIEEVIIACRITEVRVQRILAKSGVLIPDSKIRFVRYRILSWSLPPSRFRCVEFKDLFTTVQ